MRHPERASAGDGADARDGVDADDLPVGMGEVEAVVLVEELGKIEEIKPPDGIGESLGYGEGRRVRDGLKSFEKDGCANDDLWRGPAGSGCCRGAGGYRERAARRRARSLPRDPVARKAACQPPLCMVAAATSAGAMKALALDPELKRPVTRARSSDGNHSVVALMAAGKLPDSPRPSSARAMQNPMTDFTSGVSHRRECPDCDRKGVADTGAHLVDDAAGREKTEAIGDLETDHDVAVVVVEDGLVDGVDAMGPSP